METFQCGGVLINEQFVLTAAHCVKGTGKYQLVGVRLGEWDLLAQEDCDNSRDPPDCSNGVTNVGLNATYVHPNYSPLDRYKFNDIALLKMSHAVTYNRFIQPICLPSSKTLRNKNYADEDLVLTGWGQTESGELLLSRARYLTIFG